YRSLPTTHVAGRPPFVEASDTGDSRAPTTVCAVSHLLKRLSAAPGVYRGRGDGLESGPFVARIKVTSIVRGNAVTIDYEAFSDSKGLQHVEHTILTTGEAGGLELHVACLELPGVTRFAELHRGGFTAYQAPMPAKIIVTAPHDGVLAYDWWWSRNEWEPREQSRAEVR